MKWMRKLLSTTKNKNTNINRRWNIHSISWSSSARSARGDMRPTKTTAMTTTITTEKKHTHTNTNKVSFAQPKWKTFFSLLRASAWLKCSVSDFVDVFKSLAFYPNVSACDVYLFRGVMVSPITTIVENEWKFQHQVFSKGSTTSFSRSLRTHTQRIA